MSLATTRFTQALLDLEDAAPDVLFDVVPGASVPLWPQVRMNLSLALSETELTSVAVGTADTRADALARAARSFLPSRWDAAGLRAQRDLVYVSGGVTTTTSSAGVRNWLIGDYAEQFPDDSAILQWRAIGRDAPPAFPLTRTLDPLRARAEVRSRVRPPASHADRIRAIITEFARLLGGIRDDQLEGIIASAVYADRVSGSLESEIDAVLDRLRPRVVFFDSPVDGGWGAAIAAMKRRGARVVEPQHGWIGPGHGAYNFGAAMSAPELAVELPDELLTFGDYWSDGLRYPGPVTTIGKPHFEKAVLAAPPLEERPREVLVVSSVGEPGKTADFVIALAEALPTSWRVRFRPHPSERVTQVERYARLLGVPRVTLDDRTDVYEALASTRIVVGVASTVLFEAAGMGCRVFVRDTPYVPFIVGDLFGAPLEGVERVVDSARADGLDAGSGGPDRDSLWAPGSIAAFLRWVDERGFQP